MAIAPSLSLIDVSAPRPVRRSKGISPRFVAGYDAIAVLLFALLFGHSLEFAAAIGAGWGFIAAVATPKTLPGAESLRSSVRGVGLAAMAASMLSWVIGAVVPTPQLDMVLITLFALVIGVINRAVAFILRSRPRAPLRVLVVGAAGDQEASAEWTLRMGHGDLDVAGVCQPSGLAGTIELLQPEAVLVVPGPSLSGRQIQRLAWRTEQYGLPLLVSTRMDDVTPHRTASLRIGSMSLLYIDEARRARLSHLVKAVWEWLAAAASLILLAPLLVVVAMSIKIDSRGPVFFRQVRVGKAAVPFRIWKFRTMVVDAEAQIVRLQAREGHVLFKMTDDPRVTRVGRVLRKYSIDELPQLLNVVLGEMALVGPRPGLPSEVERYDGDPLRRLAVAPGITGLWQVSGRSDLSWEDTVRIDLDYVDNWSLLRDFGIVVRTIRAVVRGSGAY